MHLRDNTYADQPDSLCVEALQAAGVDNSDCYADFFCIGPSSLNAFTFNARNAPDGAVALCILASRCNGRSRLTGLRTLRVKETDRIAALASELRKVGCIVETGEDWITIDPSTRHDKPVIIETYNDHRMAMAFAVLGLARPGISIRNPACVAKSYPTFWKDFAKLYQ
jgi:3-phosphoshikimate 1-carboxyvinyltransferase